MHGLLHSSSPLYFASYMCFVNMVSLTRCWLRMCYMRSVVFDTIYNSKAGKTKLKICSCKRIGAKPLLLFLLQRTANLSGPFLSHSELWSYSKAVDSFWTQRNGCQLLSECWDPNRKRPPVCPHHHIEKLEALDLTYKFLKILAFILKYRVLSEIQNCHIVKKEAITET